MATRIRKHSRRLLKRRQWLSGVAWGAVLLLRRRPPRRSEIIEIIWIGHL